MKHGSIRRWAWHVLALSLSCFLSVQVAQAQVCDNVVEKRQVCKLGAGCKLETSPEYLLCRGDINHLRGQSVADARATAGAISSHMPTIAAAIIARPAIPAPVANQAKDVLVALARNPMDKNAQEKARAIVKGCASQPNITAIENCSGFYVSPQMFHDCVHEGVCIPLPPTNLALENSDQKNWLSWQVYNQQAVREKNVFVRPWVTSGNVVTKCKQEATEAGEGSAEKFAYCVTQEMGGESAKAARDCYREFSKQPARFGACLFKLKLTQTEATVAECATRIGASADSFDVLACLGADTGNTNLRNLATCAKEARGDAFLFGACVHGSKSMQSGGRLPAMKDCLSAIPVAARGEKNYLECASSSLDPGNIAAAKKLITDAECLRAANNNAVAQAKCFGLKLPDSNPFVRCSQSASTAQEFATCAALQNTDVAMVQACQAEAGGDKARLALCVSGHKAPPRTQAIVKCTTSGKNDDEIAACLLNEIGGTAKAQFDAAKNCQKTAGGNATTFALCLSGGRLLDQKSRALVNCVGDEVKADAIGRCLAGSLIPSENVKDVRLVQECAKAAAGNSARLALCVAESKGLNEDQRRVLSCVRNNISKEAAAGCIASGLIQDKNAAQAVSCAASSQGSYTQFALCVAAPQMNAEMRIAAECLTSTGGNPVAFAGCAGGRLTLKELEQCISGSWRSEDGCFGENNEVVKALNEQEKALRQVMRAAGLETAYDNMIGDLKRGRLGENNEIVKVFNVVNIVMIDGAHAAENVGKALGDTGRAILGAPKLIADAVKDFGDQRRKELERILPPLPQFPNGPDGNIRVGGNRIRLW